MFLLFSLLLGAAHAFSYSVLLMPNEAKMCFFVKVKEPRVPLHVYYSINEAKLNAQDGKLLDLHLTGPRGEIIRSVEKKGSGDFTVEVSDPGEYSACFYHVDSPSRKILDVDFSLGRSAAAKQEAAKNPTAPLEEANEKLATNLEDLLQSFRYLKNRERRNKETVEETHSRIVFLSVLEILIILGMSLLQVIVMRMLFAPSRRPRV